MTNVDITAFLLSLQKFMDVVMAAVSWRYCREKWEILCSLSWIGSMKNIPVFAKTDICNCP